MSNSFKKQNIFYATEEDANILRVTKTNGTWLKTDNLIISAYVLIMKFIIKLLKFYKYNLA